MPNVDFERVVTLTLRELQAPVDVVNVEPGSRVNDELATDSLPRVAVAVIGQAALSGQWQLAQRGQVAVYAHDETRVGARQLALSCYASLHSASDTGRRTSAGGITGCADIAVLVEVEEAVSGLHTFISTYNLITQP